MVEAKSTQPDFALQVDVDMAACTELRASLREIVAEGAVVPSFNDFVLKAAAHALRQTPAVNASYRDGGLDLHSRVNVGVAVASDSGLVVPTIFDADSRSLGSLAAEVRRLAEAVRDGSISPPQLSGGTFTVSNLGMFGMDAIYPVINTGQAAILGVGAIKRRPAEHDGQLALRPLMTLTLVCDHRVLDGADGARFLRRIVEGLERPLTLAL
jgi:pyruvate dehydrogenase E2 component (dihydrolipoamide acetyltransferase)